MKIKFTLVQGYCHHLTNLLPQLPAKLFKTGLVALERKFFKSRQRICFVSAQPFRAFLMYISIIKETNE